MKQWQMIDLATATPLGTLEIDDTKGETHYFETVVTDNHIVFGGSTNSAFLQCGYIKRDEAESIVETLQALLDDLSVYYNDGKQHVSRIVCNERM